MLILRFVISLWTAKGGGIGDLTLSDGEFDMVANWPNTRHFCGRVETGYEFNWLC